MKDPQDDSNTAGLEEGHGRVIGHRYSSRATVPDKDCHHSIETDRQQEIAPVVTLVGELSSHQGRVLSVPGTELGV